MTLTSIAPLERRLDVTGDKVLLHPIFADTGLTLCQTRWPALTCTCGWYTLVWPPPPRNGGYPGGAAWLLEQVRKECADD
jgi:hypothetical protein